MTSNFRKSRANSGWTFLIYFIYIFDLKSAKWTGVCCQDWTGQNRKPSRRSWTLGKCHLPLISLNINRKLGPYTIDANHITQHCSLHPLFKCSIFILPMPAEETTQSIVFMHRFCTWNKLAEATLVWSKFAAPLHDHWPYDTSQTVGLLTSFISLYRMAEALHSMAIGISACV